jgi:hypothetical protein
MIRSILYWLTGFLPTRYIDQEGKPYLERSYLCTIFGKRRYIHRFVASDEDGIHNHPFLHSFSLILAGWYYQEMWSTRSVKWLLNFIGPNDFHRVVLPDNGRDVWTLFSHSPRVRDWGFLRPIDSADKSLGYKYVAESAPEDPAFSTWHLTAPTGRKLRKTRREIPLGLSYLGDLRKRGLDEGAFDPEYQRKNDKSAAMA